jgi:hypothetical protein
MDKQQAAEAITSILEDAFDNATHKTLGGYGQDMTDCREMIAEGVPKILKLFPDQQFPTDAVAETPCQFCNGDGFIEVDTRQADGTYQIDCHFCEARNDAMEVPQVDRKTKEEIIQEFCAPWSTDFYSSQLKKQILLAMEEYAQQFSAPAPPAAGPIDDVSILIKALEKIKTICDHDDYGVKADCCPVCISEFALEDYKNSVPTPARAIDYKPLIRKMMEEMNGDLITHVPQLLAAQRAKVQVIMMDAFFEAFPPGTDLEQLRKQHNEIKPCV